MDRSAPQQMQGVMYARIIPKSSIANRTTAKGESAREMTCWGWEVDAPAAELDAAPLPLWGWRGSACGHAARQTRHTHGNRPLPAQGNCLC